MEKELMTKYPEINPYLDSIQLTWMKLQNLKKRAEVKGAKVDISNEVKELTASIDNDINSIRKIVGLT